MKTEVIIEKPLFTLQGSSYNGAGTPVEIYASILRNASVGDIFNGSDTHNCGRDLKEESLEIVYKTGSGCAGLYRCFGTSNDDNPVDWEEDPRLIWFEIK